MTMVLVGCGNAADLQKIVSTQTSGGNNSQTTTTTTSTTDTKSTDTKDTTTKTNTQAPAPTLKAKTTCTDTGSLTESQWVGFGYTVLYTVNTYSDGSTTSTCKFSGLNINIANTGICALTVNASGLINDYTFICGVGVDAKFFNSVTCTGDYAYSFNVSANVGEGYTAKTIHGSVNSSSCNSVNL